MDCSNVINYLGASVNFGNTKLDSSTQAFYWADGIRATNKIICIICLFIVMIYCVFFRCIFKKRLRIRLQDLMKSTIFSFFDDLPEEIQRKAKKQKNELFPENESKPPEIQCELQKNSLKSIKTLREVSSFPSSDYDSNELKKEGDLLKKQTEGYDLSNEYNEVYICDFNECCCLCCNPSWKFNIYERCFHPCFSSFYFSIRNTLQNHLKFFCFYFLTLGAFIYNPLREVFALFFNECAVQKINHFIISFLNVIFFFVDLFCGSLNIMLYVFIMSFLNTRMELIRVYFLDKTYRANLIYYNLKKGLLFGAIFCCWKFAFKLSGFFRYACYDMMEGPFSMVWMLFKSLFLITFIKFENCMTNETIQQDCRLLRAHARYFVIQNNLLKKIPKADEIYRLLKKEIKKNDKEEFSINNEDCMFNSLKKKDLLDLIYLEQKLQNKCKKILKSLHEELKIIDSQKFKNILRNKGYLRYIPMIFTLMFTIFNLLTIVDAVVLIIKFDSDQEIFAVSYAKIGCSISIFIECSVLPILMFYCIRKSTVRKSR